MVACGRSDLAYYLMDEAAEDIEIADLDLNGDVATATHEPLARLHAMCKAFVICCQDQLQWDTPVGWWFPTRSSM